MSWRFVMSHWTPGSETVLHWFYLLGSFSYETVTFGFVMSQYYSCSENILFNFIRYFGVVSYVALTHFWTWKFYRRGCRGWWFPPDDLPQCDPLWHCPSLPFHTLCKHELFGVHLSAYLNSSPSLISPFHQVPPDPQKNSLPLQLFLLILHLALCFVVFLVCMSSLRF